VLNNIIGIDCGLLVFQFCLSQLMNQPNVHLGRGVTMETITRTVDAIRSQGPEYFIVN